MTDSAVNPSGQDATSLTLLERVRAADQAAWDRLVKLYAPLVYRWCLRAGLQTADAADVGQEVFAAVARAIGSFRHDRPGDTFRGWLYTITRNKLRDRVTPPGGVGAGGTDAHRLLTNRPAEAPADSADDAPSEADDDQFVYRRAVELIRGEFEPRTWEAFWQTAVEGRGPADVAAALGVTVNAVYLAR